VLEFVVTWGTGKALTALSKARLLAKLANGLEKMEGLSAAVRSRLVGSTRKLSNLLEISEEAAKAAKVREAVAKGGGLAKDLAESAITRKSQLIRALKGTTPEATEIANAIEKGDIQVRILGEDSFVKWYKKLGGKKDPKFIEAFQDGDTIFLRRGSDNIVSKTVHEGVHALDELRGFQGTDIQWELRARFAERRFQMATDRPVDFPNARDIYKFVRKAYGKPK
jgi:hypothetical protein